jgi:hypothetical protein
MVPDHTNTVISVTQFINFNQNGAQIPQVKKLEKQIKIDKVFQLH